MAEPNLDHIVEPLRPLAVPVADLVLDPKNAREHGEEDLAELSAWLDESGQDQAILVQQEGNIVRKGNGRVMAAQRLGWTHIAAVVVDISEADGVKRAVVDNRIAERSKWNTPHLMEALTFLDEEGAALGELGFDDAFMAKLMSDNESLVQEAAKLNPAAAVESPEHARDEAAMIEAPRTGVFNAPLVFKSKEDRAAWVTWTRKLRDTYPGLETLGDRLAAFVRDVG